MVYLLFSFAFLAVYRHNQKYEAALLFGLSYCIGSFGFLIDFFRDYFIAYWTASLANTCYATTLFLFVHASYLWSGIQRPWKSTILTLAISGIGFGYLMFVEPHFVLRTVWINFCYGVMTLIGIPAFYAAATSKLRKALAVAYALTCLQFFVRPIVVLQVSQTPLTWEAYSQSLFSAAVHMTMAVAAIGLGMGLLISFVMRIIEDLKANSQTDVLSGLCNRGGFETNSLKLVNDSRKSGKPISIVTANIDHCKMVNDNHGHAFGDVVIQRFGQLILKQVRPSDVAARMAGEEFVIVLEDTSLRDATAIAQHLRVGFSRNNFSEDPFVSGSYLTCSFGVAQLARDERLEKTLKRADAALYLSKSKGRNRVSTEEDLGVKQLRSALSSDEEDKYAEMLQSARR